MRRLDSLELAEQGGGLGRVVTTPRNRVDDMPLASYNMKRFSATAFASALLLSLGVTLSLVRTQSMKVNPRPAIKD